VKPCSGPLVLIGMRLWSPQGGTWRRVLRKAGSASPAHWQEVSTPCPASSLASNNQKKDHGQIKN
jgi:hypothetical protein